MDDCKINESDLSLIYKELNNTIAIEICGHVYYFSNDKYEKFPRELICRCGIGYQLIREAVPLGPLPIKIGYKYNNWYDIEYQWLHTLEVAGPSIPPTPGSKIEINLLLDGKECGLTMHWEVEEENKNVSLPLPSGGITAIWMPNYFVLELHKTLGKSILNKWFESPNFKLWQEMNGVVI